MAMGAPRIVVDDDFRDGSPSTCGREPTRIQGRDGDCRPQIWRSLMVSTVRPIKVSNSGHQDGRLYFGDDRRRVVGAW